MRIIAGEAGGRRLVAPSGEDTRPTAEKTRGSLFNILGVRVIGANVLDLFGGTGALALEALSRGAEKAVVCDNGRNAIRAIEQNADVVLKNTGRERLRVMKSDYRAAISAMRGEKFGIVFLDPPYRMEDAYADALTRLKAAGALAEGCLILCERLSDRAIVYPEGFTVADTRKYRDTAVDFLREET